MVDRLPRNRPPRPVRQGSRDCRRDPQLCRPTIILGILAIRHCIFAVHGLQGRPYTWD